MMVTVLIMLMIVIKTATASASSSAVNIKPGLESDSAKQTLHFCYQLQQKVTEIPSNISDDAECM